MDPDLPLLDLGCGNGRQSRFLARHFPLVIGADISASAIRLARTETPENANVVYRVFDALDTDAVEMLHAEYGDLNVYMRGVLHMIRWHERHRFIENIGCLLGLQGTLYQIELGSESILKLRRLPEGVFVQIPKVTRRVGFNLEDRSRFYPDDSWCVVAQGSDVALQSIPLPDGTVEGMPGNYLILRKRTGQADSGRPQEPRSS
jgi:SAM-dependent methyltransferase